MGKGEEREKEKMQALDKCREGEGMGRGEEKEQEGERGEMRETDKKGKEQQGKRMTGRKGGGRGMHIPTLYHDPRQRPRGCSSTILPCAQPPPIKVLRCLLSQSC